MDALWCTDALMDEAQGCIVVYGCIVVHGCIDGWSQGCIIGGPMDALRRGCGCVDGRGPGMP
eukprot:1161254-Pelagomonas_calceolata.AAC.2